jgi:hypothetical protein
MNYRTQINSSWRINGNTVALMSYCAGEIGESSKCLRSRIVYRGYIEQDTKDEELVLCTMSC